jgi:hypothetical protein
MMKTAWDRFDLKLAQIYLPCRMPHARESNVAFQLQLRHSTYAQNNTSKTTIQSCLFQNEPRASEQNPPIQRY